ncbi:Hypp8500 [Branchiostoma lanceolatum]|uniref:Hypp8500 protein n=1 Tax=Branchiostoma lanceolatum TaxID=7740 RepID=A0A8J9Z8H1_BRALA|nr:Hypp8500 [Branchiostoma lanceolatum]
MANVQPAAAAQPAAGNQAPPRFSGSVFRALFILTAVQHLLWVPQVILGIIYALKGGNSNVPSTAKFWIIWLGQCNTLADFIIYSAAQKSFRKALKSLCRKPVNFMWRHLAGRDFFGTPVVQFQAQDTVSQNATLGQSNEMSGEDFPLQTQPERHPVQTTSDPTPSQTVAEAPVSTPGTAVAETNAPASRRNVAERHFASAASVSSSRTTEAEIHAPASRRIVAETRAPTSKGNVAERHSARAAHASAMTTLAEALLTRSRDIPVPALSETAGFTSRRVIQGEDTHDSRSSTPADLSDTEQSPIRLDDIFIDHTLLHQAVSTDGDEEEIEFKEDMIIPLPGL